MKKIIGLVIGFFVSILIFIPFWFQAAKVFLMPQESLSRYCQTQKVCNDCKSDYKCLKDKCDAKILDNCNYIEENYNQVAGVLSSEEKNIIGNKEDFFVNSLCGSGLKNKPSCPVKINTADALFKTGTITLALHYVALFFKVGYLLFYLQVFNSTWLMGILILLIPIILGFYLGLLFDIKKSLKNK